MKPAQSQKAADTAQPPQADETLCSQHHIALDHHDALSDAVACAHLFMIAQGLRLREA